MFEHGFPSHWSTIRKLMWLKRATGGGGRLVTLTGAIVSFIAKAVAPLNALTVAIEPQQTEITQASVYVYGKNLFDKANLYETSRYIKSDGTLVSNASWVVSSAIPVKAGETYTLSNYQNSNTSAPGVRFYGNDGGIIGFSYGSTRTKTFTVPDGALTMRISVMASLIDSCQLELGSTATDYESFNGTTYLISWQTEVGSITSGTLTIDGNGGVTLDTGGVTHQLESITPITLLVGKNNVWANRGDVTVTAQGITPIG